jgi:hypothetical protein
MVAWNRIPTPALVLCAAFSAASSAPGETPDGIASGRRGGSIEGSVLVTVTRALQMAVTKLRSQGCRSLFAESRDVAGRPLDAVLADLGETPLERLLLLDVRDGTYEAPCKRQGVYAYTSLGGTTVFVCPSFVLLSKQEPRSAANLLIHEVLHSLGVGEAPMPGEPSSQDITVHVERRCGK